MFKNHLDFDSINILHEIRHKKKGTFQPEIKQLKISNYFPFLSSSGKLHTLGIFLPHLIESRISGLTSR